ncbi:MAG: DNA polymerase III subunit gamma/tau, partial [Clostridia bacterium]|nr:DNA polymerase III subunit gamma/tau [Clostridia bacterium]
MYLALYRKYRPRTFEEVIGQDHIVKTLVNQIKLDKISHAYLFTGSRGTGKTSTAKIFAKAINCADSKNGSPCGKCEVCKSLDGANIDVLEIDAASNNGVDEIRDLREKVKYPPVVGKYKVYIIDEVHMLSTSAFNALLKTLEEPPAHTVFILATTEVHKLPATILSRCLRFDYKLVSLEDLSNLLKSILKAENVTFDEQAINIIARAGEGSVRDTL